MKVEEAFEVVELEEETEVEEVGAGHRTPRAPWRPSQRPRLGPHSTGCSSQAEWRSCQARAGPGALPHPLVCSGPGMAAAQAPPSWVGGG